MKILEVKVTGFKSFVDSVSIPIESGLTGIVGPNGCGKSNVLESIRWVMGATSAKALRGSEMDDVIFAGTDTRPSRDIAEVIIRLDNSEFKAPTPYKNVPIIEISRKIRRTMGSVFRINGKEVRAKDVQLLFADASSGANSPAFVRQGQVSELINARPENRRRVLEEAAGIAGLQARRHEAQIKLNATETNLERVGEHLILMENQISSLKKQATRARKYRELQSQIRGLELYLASNRLETMRAALLKTQEDARNGQIMAADALSKIAQKQKQLELSQSGLKPLLEEQAIADALLRRFEARRIEFERDIQDVKAKIENLNNENARLNRDIIRENEFLTDAETAISKAQAEIDELKTFDNGDDDFSDFEAKAQSLKVEISKLETQLSGISNQKAEINAKIREAEREKQARELRISNLDNEIANKNKSIAALKFEIENDNSSSFAIKKLEDAQSFYDNHNQAIEANSKELLLCEAENEEQKQACEQIEHALNALKSELRGIDAILQSAKAGDSESLLDQIKVQSGYERAFGAALGDDLNAKIGKSGDRFWTSVDNKGFEWPKELSNFPILSEFVGAPNELMARLNAIILVDELFDLPLPKGARAVTKTGKLIRWDGFVSNDSNSGQNAIFLEARNRKNAIEPIILEKNEALSNSRAIFAKTRARLSSLRDIEKNQRLQTREIISKLEQAQKEVSTAQTLISSKKARQEEFENGLATLLLQLDQAKSIEQSEAPIDPKSIAILDNDALEIGTKLKTLRDEFSQFQSNILNIKNQKAQNEKRLENAKSELLAWNKRHESADIRKSELESELAKCQSEIESIKNRPIEIENQKITALSELPKIEERKKKADDALAINNAENKAIEGELKNLEMQLNAAKEAANAAQIIINSWEERIGELETQILNEHQTAIKDLTNNINSQLGDLVNNLTIEKATQRLQKAFSERDEIGGVNLRADEELSEVSEKFETLSKERDELLKAISKLKKAIDEINDEGKEKLLAAFDIVNQHFSELFTALFGGGNAHLALSETDDPLGGGLEVYACPPGKRLTSMSLMSGGEQALTATALIFAVFLSNPAPLSVLDELDAPLDDANVDRFCALMDEMRKRTDTRFIVITHHPITMARMDRLFGVTMAERGVSNVVAVDLTRAQSMIEAA